MVKKLIIVLLSVVTALSAKAQENDHGVEQLKKQLSVYLAEHTTSNLYLHLDKNIYSPEETIWFKAYLLGDTATDNKVLYVRITDEDKEIVLNAQFPMYDIRAHGDLQLPARLTEGKYTLYSYTDRMLSYGDTNVFVQPIRIRKNIGKKLEAEALVSDTTQLVRGGKVQVMARIRESGGLVKKVKGEYELIAGEKTIKYGRLTTNELGESFINFTYPELTNNQSLKVNMLFSRDNDYAELLLNLPHEGNPLKINICPEGGQLIADVNGKVAIEVSDIHQNPVSTELLIKKAGQTIGKIRSNKQGIATINLKAETGFDYTVETASGRNKQTVRFPPVIHPEGYSLKLQNNEEQATAIVFNKNKPENALLVLRSSNEILWSKSITVASGDSVKVSIPAADFPKNILSLAVLDGENKPQTERLFLNKVREDYKLTISTLQKDYGLQKKVTVTINIADIQGNPVVANLSVAATEKNRIDSTQYRTILQSWYYRPFEQANRSRLQSAKSAKETDGLLMANTWGNNQWKTISDYQSKGLPLRLDNTDAAIGMVKGKLKEIYMHSSARDLSAIDLSAIELNKKYTIPFKQVAIRLDENNRFIVPSSDLLSWKGKEWILDGAGIKFNVQWEDHDIQFDQTIVKERILQGPENVNGFANSKIPKESPVTFTGINQLAEVRIGGKEERIRRTLKDECTDWICGECGSLNCPVRPESKPIKGKIYHYRRPEFFGYDKTASYKVIYLGCGNYRDVSYIKNITNPEEFYLPDYDTNPSAKDDTRSTIYWNPNLVTDANGTATFSFFTSDIMGEFEIIAQGLEVNTFTPLMGKGNFKVVGQ